MTPFGSQAQELFEQLNKEFTEHITHKTWTNFAVEEFTAKWLAVDYGKLVMDEDGNWIPDPAGEARIRAFLQDEGNAEHPIVKLLDRARLTSGAIGGKISEKFVEAARGSTPQSVGLSIQGAQPADAPPLPPAQQRKWGQR